jgi:hypothetical protein
MSPILIEHEGDVWGFLEDPNPKTLQALCEGEVRWLWIDVNRVTQAAWMNFYQPRFTSPDTIIAELMPTSCQ